MTSKVLVSLIGIFLSIAGNCQKWRVVRKELIFQNPPFISCHASTIVELGAGKLMAAYFGGDYERARNVVIWMSVFENNKWAAPLKIADGVENDSLQYPCWNPVLFKSREGKIHLFYKVGPSPSSWWGMLKTSTDDGKTWSSATKLPMGILGPIKNKPIQLPNGVILSPSSTETGTWKVHIERSIDNGQTWKIHRVDPSTKFTVIQPTLLVYPNSTIQMLCRSGNDYILESWSKDDGQSWSTLALTKLPNPNSGIDGVTLKNGSQLLVYNPTRRGKNGRAKLVVASSKDGKKWNEIFVLENEPEGEFSYPAIILAKDGKVHITYTHNRKNIKYVVLEQGK